MRLRHRSFATRLSLVLAVLLLAYGLLVGAWTQHAFKTHEQEALQRISHGLARHIVEHWPAITSSDPERAAREEREKLLSMLMVVNPGVQAYVLDINGQVQAYIGEPGMVREHQVDLSKVQAFLAGAPLPLLGTDPMGSGKLRVFSAAMFPPRSGDPRPPGYLYIVLDGAARDDVAVTWGHRLVWQGGMAVASIGLALTLLVGVFTFRRLTLPLHHLAQRLQAYGPAASPLPAQARAVASHDEVQAIAQAFESLSERLQAHAAREQQQEKEHREAMAGLAHDLRTPLTALHGHLEGLLGPAGAEPGRRDGMLLAALAQSDKVRRLSQQLFELAALQSSDQVMHQERFSLDELITDTVRKFEVGQAFPPVVLGGPEPGALAVHGDLQLVERALTNLIDNAIRHGGGETTPVRVSVSRQDGQAHIVIEDLGPGLPQDVAHRLSMAQSLRDPPLKRTSGGIGGLGLAIAQRVAMLHGGSLKPVHIRGQGACLCLALPLVD